MEGLSSLQKIGQRFAAGFQSYEISEEFVNLVKDYKIGNVILFKENIKSREQLFALCGELQKLIQRETGHPAFIAIDQEGGVVSRLGSDAAVIPSAMAIAATGNAQNAYEAGLITGRELMAMGVNMNLAPDMDVNSNPCNPVIGVRSYGDTADAVSRFGTQMIRGLRDAGVLCTAKHFPGHGNMVMDELASRITNGAQRFDEDGRLAKSGSISQSLLNELMEDAYLTAPPPKSTGREAYGKAYVDALVQKGLALGLSLTDILATAARFTAETIRVGIERFCKPVPDRLIVGGGGSMNPILMRHIAKCLPGMEVMRNEDLGLDSNAKEAVAFAILANETLHMHCSNVPAATGAGHPAILGKISF